jgi:hypothetical protein
LYPGLLGTTEHRPEGYVAILGVGRETDGVGTGLERIVGRESVVHSSAINDDDLLSLFVVCGDVCNPAKFSGLITGELDGAGGFKLVWEIQILAHVANVVDAANARMSDRYNGRLWRIYRPTANSDEIS